MEENKIVELDNGKKKGLVIILILAVALLSVGFIVYNHFTSDGYIYKEFVKAFPGKVSEKFVYTEKGMSKLKEDDKVFFFLKDIENMDGHIFGYLENKDHEDTEEIMVRLSMPETNSWKESFSEDMLVYGRFIKEKRERVSGDKETYYWFQTYGHANVSHSKKKITEIYMLNNPSKDDELKVGDKICLYGTSGQKPESIKYKDEYYIVLNGLCKTDFDKDKVRDQNIKFIVKYSNEKMNEYLNCQMDTKNDKVNKFRSDVWARQGRGVILPNCVVVDTTGKDIFVLEQVSDDLYDDSLSSVYWFDFNKKDIELEDRLDFEVFIEDFVPAFIDEINEEYDMTEKQILSIISGNEDEANDAYIEWESHKNFLEVQEEVEEESSSTSKPIRDNEYSSTDYLYIVVPLYSYDDSYEAYIVCDVYSNQYDYDIGAASDMIPIFINRGDWMYDEPLYVDDIYTGENGEYYIY